MAKRASRDGSTNVVDVLPYGELSAAARRRLQPAIDCIFFDASHTQTFTNAETRQAFHRLWLGRYLEEEPENAFLALASNDELAGYLVGSLDDPAPRAAFAGLDYFRSFAHLTPRYPAHLHINMAASQRSKGTGARLIEAFVAHACAHDVPGVHIVTGAGQRNVSFYHRVGFREVGRATHGAGEVVMLARAIRPDTMPDGPGQNTASP